MIMTVLEPVIYIDSTNLVIVVGIGSYRNRMHHSVQLHHQTQTQHQAQAQTQTQTQHHQVVQQKELLSIVSMTDSHIVAMLLMVIVDEVVLQFVKVN